MANIILLLIAAVVVIDWCLDFPIAAKLRKKKDGFIFRTKAPEVFRFQDRQDTIDDLASRLESSGTTNQRHNSDND